MKGKEFKEKASGPYYMYCSEPYDEYTLGLNESQFEEISERNVMIPGYG